MALRGEQGAEIAARIALGLAADLFDFARFIGPERIAGRSPNAGDIAAAIGLLELQTPRRRTGGGVADIHLNGAVHHVEGEGQLSIATS